MLNAINRYEVERNNEIANKREAAISEFVKWGKIVESRIAEIISLKQVVMKLRSLGIGNYDYNLYNEFETNGIKHNLGFVRENYTVFGYEAGGADGSRSCFLKLTTEEWDNRKWQVSENSHPQTLEDFANEYAENYFVARKLKEMANGGIDKYIEALNATISKL